VKSKYKDAVSEPTFIMVHSFLASWCRLDNDGRWGRGILLRRDFVVAQRHVAQLEYHFVHALATLTRYFKVWYSEFLCQLRGFVKRYLPARYTFLRKVYLGTNEYKLHNLERANTPSVCEYFSDGLECVGIGDIKEDKNTLSLPEVRSRHIYAPISM
jgi:hypothetical protein